MPSVKIHETGLFLGLFFISKVGITTLAAKCLQDPELLSSTSGWLFRLLYLSCSCLLA